MEILTPEKVEQLEEASLEINNSFRESWQKVMDINEPLELKELAKTLSDYFSDSIMFLSNKLEEIHHNKPIEEISIEESSGEYASEYNDYLKVKNPMLLIGEALFTIGISYSSSLRRDKDIEKSLDEMDAALPGIIKNKERSFELITNSARDEYDEFKEVGFLGVVERYCEFYWNESFPRTEVWKMLDVRETVFTILEFKRAWKAVRKELELRVRVEEG